MGKIRLTSVCNITTGKLDANAAVINGKYPYFTCAPQALAINTYAFDDDAILLAGNNAVGNFHCQRYNGKFNAYQRTYVITAKCGFDIDYIYYSLKLNLGVLKKRAQGSQTKFLTMQLLDLFEIEEIPLDRQKQIVNVLKHIDSKILNNNLISTELELMAKTIYDYYFLQFDFPDENGKPYKSSGGKMVWNDKLQREIPEGWKVESIFNCMDTTYGVPLSTNYFNDKNGIPVIRIRDIPENTISTLTEELVEEKYLTKRKDLLVGMDGNFYMNFWANNGDCVNQRIFRVRDKDKVSALQVYFEIAPYIKAKESNIARSTVGHLSDKDFKGMKILVPDSYEIYKMFDMILSKLCLNKRENQGLVSLREFLLPLLLNGQVSFREN